MGVCIFIDMCIHILYIYKYVYIYILRTIFDPCSGCLSGECLDTVNHFVTARGDMLFFFKDSVLEPNRSWRMAGKSVHTGHVNIYGPQSTLLWLSSHSHIYIYIYVHIDICILMYIYVYMGAARFPGPQELCQST